MKFPHGCRVRHKTETTRAGKPVTGRVHVFADAGPDEVAAEVRWDGSFVASELSLVEADLELIRLRYIRTT